MRTDMRTLRKDILYPDLSFVINGVLFKARGSAGKFKSEKQFCDDIEEEFKIRGINYEREKSIDKRNRIDFLVENKIALEVKVKSVLTKEDYYQIRRYLDALNIRLGILVNMRYYPVYPKRILNSKADDGSQSSHTIS